MTARTILILLCFGAAIAGAADRLPQASSSEPGPSWDPRPAWQRATDGSWRAIFQRRAVVKEVPSDIVPVADNRPFRIPRAMSPLPREMAPAVHPLADDAPGKFVVAPCRKAVNHNAPRGTDGEAQFVANLGRIIEVIKRDPLFPPPGFEVKVGCSYERRTDGSAIYQGKILLLFYPYSAGNRYWHGGLEILVNDLGVLGPRNNSEDRADDPNQVFDLPAPATYRGLPYLPAEHLVWGGAYLTQRPNDIWRFVTYREWIDANLPRLEKEFKQYKAVAESSPTVRNQVVMRNLQSMYERTMLARDRMPPEELETPAWIADLAPSDAANFDAARLARLNVPGYFNRKLPPYAIQLINILPVHSKYNHLHAVLEKLDFVALRNLVQ